MDVQRLWPGTGSSLERGTAVHPSRLSTGSLGKRQRERAEVTRSPGNVGSRGWASSRSVQPETSS